MTASPEIIPRDRPDKPAAGQRRGPLATGLALLSAGIGVFLVWQTVSSLLIIFAAILFAAFLDAAKRSHRPRVRAVMDEMGNVLRLWFIGQVIRIVLMTLCVWIALYLIGLPSPFVLGSQAGLSNFIPYLGLIVAAIPIALVAMPLDVSVLV